jgi:hypothetical protein
VVAEPFNLADMADQSLPVDPIDPDFRWTDWITIQNVRQDRAVQAALGHDVTPGHDQLHHFWTQGPGLARWADSPTPWTTLLANLVEEVKDKPLEVLKKWACRWFIEVFHYAAGSDMNRVTHGHPPRGHNIGPG